MTGQLQGKVLHEIFFVFYEDSMSSLDFSHYQQKPVLVHLYSISSIKTLLITLTFLCLSLLWSGWMFLSFYVMFRKVSYLLFVLLKTDYILSKCLISFLSLPILFNIRKKIKKNAIKVASLGEIYFRKICKGGGIKVFSVDSHFYLGHFYSTVMWATILLQNDNTNAFTLPTKRVQPNGYSRNEPNRRNNDSFIGNRSATHE